MVSLSTSKDTSPFFMLIFIKQSGAACSLQHIWMLLPATMSPLYR